MKNFLKPEIGKRSQMSFKKALLFFLIAIFLWFVLPIAVFFFMISKGGLGV